MDNDVLVNILCQTHILQTCLENSAYSFNISFNPNNIDYKKCQLLLTNNDEFTKFVEECLKTFIELNPTLLYGSVHLKPEVWVKFAFITICYAYDNNLNQLNFPNGCCDTGFSCPINLFYLVVSEKLVLK